MFNREKLRETFYTPYEEMAEHNGKRFELIRELTTLEIGDEGLKGELFKIRFEDGTEITAWYEEIFSDSCTVNGILM